MIQRIVPAIFVLLSVLSAAGCASGDTGLRATTAKEDALKPQPVQTARVALRDRQPVVTTTGTLVPRRHAELRALSEGRIDVMAVDIGSRVRAGQTLLQVRTVDYRNALDQAEAALARAEAVLADREREKRRAEGLYAEGSATEQMRDQAATALDDARAGLREAQVRVTTARQALEDCTIRAPYDGAITMRIRQRGEFVARGDAVVEIMDLSVLEAEMEIPEPYAGSISVGLPATIAVRSGGTSVSGRVVAVNPKVDLVTRTFRVKVEVDNADGSLQANLFCTGRFELPVRSDAPAVPAEAVQRDEGRSFVWIVNDGKVSQRIIREAGASDGWIFVEDGLRGDEDIVVAGAGGLHEGAAVEESPVSR